MTNKQLFSYWKSSFESSGIKVEFQDVYLSYATPLILNEVPIIFDFQHLCLLLGRNKSYLSSVVNSNKSHYRTFKIPKSKGGFRDITAPFPALMECQLWIYNNILKKIKVHAAAQGFTFKKSIISNSKYHVNQQEFLKIDLKDFFPSIKINRIISIFKRLGYSNKVSFYLASICCFGDELPQGAPTSPILSNIITFGLDTRLLAFARKFDLRYTRYADDLAFSGKRIPVKFIEYISNIISEMGFEVNKEKTFLQNRTGKRILTGVSIAGEKIRLPRDYKRNLKLELYFIKRYGLMSHILKKKIKHPNYLQSIIGKVNFWLSIEPDSDLAKGHLAYLQTLIEHS